MTSSGTPLVLAVPSKGRLQENATEFFARAGLELVQGRGARDYRGSIANVPGVEVAFLSASEIVGQLVAGAAHFGVTGEDLVRENVFDVDDSLVLLTPLGFGRANVVVAVPQAWIDVRTMADLEDVAAHFRAKRGNRMRVATKYLNLTRRFFATHGVADYRIVESLGATEGAPAAGGAELIVDITTTGATLAANALKIVEDGVILRSQANLVASLKASWAPSVRSAARTLLSHIAATEEARRSREVRARLPSPAYLAVEQAREKFGAIAAYGEEADPQGLVVLHCSQAQVADVADWLIGQGADRVTVHNFEQVFDRKKRTSRRLAGQDRRFVIVRDCGSGIFVDPGLLIAFSFSMSGRISGLNAHLSKSASQRSGAIKRKVGSKKHLVLKLSIRILYNLRRKVFWHPT